jgi:hypothetical protein
MHSLEQVRKPFLNGLPTVNRSFRRHQNGVLREKWSDDDGGVVIDCIGKIFNDATSFSRSCGSGLFVWAKIGKAKLIASPARAMNKRVFIVSSSWI